MRRFYPWSDLRNAGVHLDDVLSETFEANRRYRVHPRRFPIRFLGYLAKDGFDLERNVTLEAGIEANVFGVVIEQD